jgi:hypothetical protein
VLSRSGVDSALVQPGRGTLWLGSLAAEAPAATTTRTTIMNVKRLCLAATLCLAPLGANAGSADMARIVTQNVKPADCISRVAIRQINGEEKFVSPQGFELEPGRYTMSGTVALDTSYCKAPQRRSPINVPPLEAEFEAGKTYYIGFDHSSTNREEWHYVIWKVE